MSYENCMDYLLVEINKKRESMISVANITGLESEQTIKCSQDLDKLIFEYQKTMIKKKRRMATFQAKVE